MSKLIGLSVSLLAAISSWNASYVVRTMHHHHVVITHHKESTIQNVVVLGREVLRIETWFNTVYKNPQRPAGKLPAYRTQVQTMIGDACHIAANIHTSLPTFEGVFASNYCS